jgi:hypothetical protein
MFVAVREKTTHFFVGCLHGRNMHRRSKYVYVVRTVLCGDASRIVRESNMWVCCEHPAIRRKSDSGFGGLLLRQWILEILCIRVERQGRGGFCTASSKNPPYFERLNIVACRFSTSANIFDGGRTLHGGYFLTYINGGMLFINYHGKKYGIICRQGYQCSAHRESVINR